MGARCTAGLDGSCLISKKPRVLPSVDFGPDEVGEFSFAGDLSLPWKHLAFPTCKRGNWTRDTGHRPGEKHLQPEPAIRCQLRQPSRLGQFPGTARGRPPVPLLRFERGIRILLKPRVAARSRGLSPGPESSVRPAPIQDRCVRSDSPSR